MTQTVFANNPIVTRTFKVRFLTPAFLGNADQSGQWRTPPFKHLLREWWRVAWAQANGFSNDVPTMRDTEALLFGSAADGTGRRSRLRLRLGKWEEGSMKKQSWELLDKVKHPEVKFPVDAGLYLGYGPVTLTKGSKSPELKKNAAIQAGDEAVLNLALPESDAGLIDQALFLIHEFGAVGGRSRNGWGSLLLIGGLESVPYPLRDWRECLDRDWAHAIGEDKRGALIWQTGAFDNWRELMTVLAEIKIGLRTQFAFPNIKPPHKHVESRHWLAYPVTRHATLAWERNARLPNSLRFKVIEKSGKLRGRIFHVPCLPPPQFNSNVKAITSVWEKVHAFLDRRGELTRSDAV